jgi:hypothetical protein
MTGVWKSGMAAWCWLVIVFGAVLTTATFPVTDAPARLVMGVISGAPASFDDNALRFAFGLMGALTIGWGMTVQALLRHDVGTPVWRGVTVAVLVWYVVDSAASVATGFPLNAVSNTLITALFLACVAGSGVWRQESMRGASASREVR